MMKDISTENGSLVELTAAENQFLVPEADHKTAVSEDTFTTHKANTTLPREVFDRDTLLFEGNIASTDTPFINLLGDFDPFYQYLVDPLIAQYIQPFHMAQMDMIITVRIIAPGSCYGAYNVQCLCEGGRALDAPPTIDGPVFDAYPNSTQDVHGFMNVEVKNDLVFELPWVHFKDSFAFADLSGGQDNGPGCWRMLIWALSPIQNTISTDIATGRIQIYGRLGERDFQNLRFQARKRKSPSGEIGEKYPVKEDKWKASSVVNTIGKGVGLVGSLFPELAPLTIPASGFLAGGSKLLEALGFTREYQPPSVLHTKSVPVFNLSNVDHIDSSLKTAMSIENAVSNDPAPGGGEHLDPTSYAALFERWTVSSVFDIVPEDAVGDTLQDIPVTPYFCNQILGAFYPTTGGYVGATFANWRGGMEYLIYIPSSQNLQGSLQVLWQPDIANIVPFPTDPTNRLANTIIDLSSTSRTMIRVDYSQPDPALASNFMSTMPPLGTNSANGYLRFRLNAPLTAPRSTGFTLRVIVMARPCQDMTFGVPTSIIRLDDNEHALSDLRYQAAEVEEEVDHVTVLSKARGSYPVKEVLFGEDFRSVRALMQYFSPTNLPPELGPIRYPHFPYCPSASFPGSGFTYLGWYQAAFVGVRGGTRLKVVSGGATSSTILSGPLPAGSTQDMSLVTVISPHEYFDLTPGRAAEFSYPSYYRYKQYLTRWQEPLVSSPYVRNNFIKPESNLSGVQVYVAASDDFTPTRFRRIPAFLTPVP